MKHVIIAAALAGWLAGALSGGCVAVMIVVAAQTRAITDAESQQQGFGIITLQAR